MGFKTLKKMNKFRKGILALVYKKEKNKIFLVLKRKLHWKGFEIVKGGIEKGESKIEALKRELKEETGLKIKKIEDLHMKGKFLYPKNFEGWPGYKGMKYSCYAVEVFPGKVKIDEREHSDYKWMEYDKIISKLTWKEQKAVVDRFKLIKGII